MKEIETSSKSDVDYLLNKYKANFRREHAPKWTWQEVTGYKTFGTGCCGYK